MLGGNAIDVYGFDAEKLGKLAEQVGPSIASIRGEA
jgi:hypothetical protein